jgi:(p)ppGpp synthase/HD superfamily hydrolase
LRRPLRAAQPVAARLSQSVSVVVEALDQSTLRQQQHCVVKTVLHEHVLIAAVLHDTIEDTETNEPELLRLFGKDVTDIVVEVTDDKSLPKAERKRLKVEHAAHISRRAKLVKLADKICNLRDTRSHRRQIGLLSGSRDISIGQRLS